MATNLTLDKSVIDESNRCLHCVKPSCVAACPLSNDIPTFLQLVAEGKPSCAVQLIGHPFGEICGYVCPHDAACQGSCILAKMGKNVHMGEVERAVFAKYPYQVVRKVYSGHKSRGLKVAVVGGGVSGITLAVKLYEQGADVTVFERDELLSTLKLIPDFRLPKEAIDRVLESIEGKFTVVKKDVNCDDIFGTCTQQSKRNQQGNGLQLLREYDAVYLSTGASVAYTLGVCGEQLATPYDAFLKGNEHCGKVVVVGGGNTAMDCARLAKRNGCDVTVAYRRTRADMPAFAKEVDDAESEKVEFMYNVAPQKLEKVGDKLHLTLAKTISVGRGKLTVTDDMFTVECDCVVSAVGARFDKNSLYGAFDPLSIDDGEQHSQSNPCANLFVGGDAIVAGTVAQAVADGIKAANEIVKLHTK